MKLDLKTGLIDSARWVASPNFDARETHDFPAVVILHSISLPPGQYDSDAIERFFCNQLDGTAHAYFEEICHLNVSSHFLIRRNGELIQFVSTLNRAWHAGESACLSKPNVNDFSIGVELEGLDTGTDGFTTSQYEVLNQLLSALQHAYPKISVRHIFAHSDIAPGRKIDPGLNFNWSQLHL